MLVFTLAIACLTTSNTPWSMDITFQVPMQYCSYSIWLYFHQQSRPQWVLFCFDSCSSFFLELFLHWSPVAYWAPADLGSSSFSILSFCLFILFMGFSRQEYWSGLPFPSPVDHILSLLPLKKRLSHVWLLATSWTIADQVPLSMGFSRQEHWNELPFPSLGDLPDSDIEPGSSALQEVSWFAGGVFTNWATREND